MDSESEVPMKPFLQSRVVIRWNWTAHTPSTDVVKFLVDMWVYYLRVFSIDKPDPNSNKKIQHKGFTNRNHTAPLNGRSYYGAIDFCLVIIHDTVAWKVVIIVSILCSKISH